MPTQPTASRPRVVIIGAGFGGLAVARTLGGAAIDITIIDRTNHHLFQPLLYQVATAGLSPADIAAPVRGILRKQKNVSILMGEVTRIDTENKCVHAGESLIRYDYLVLAAGARHSYFGNRDWERRAPGLKTLGDAVELRERILGAFESAENSASPDERMRALTFVVVGGGPTGVEMAGAISELARFTLNLEFKNIRPADARVILVEAGPRVLPMFPCSLSEKACTHLAELGVSVRTGEPVRDLRDGEVLVGEDVIPCDTVVWAAGNAASPLGAQAGAPLDKAGRVMVGADLSAPGAEGVFVIGDLAHFEGPDGNPLPAVSPVAIQQGKRAASNILRLIGGNPALPFRYFDKGSMATVGRHRAVALIGPLGFGGFMAWLGWLFVHLIFLVGFRNRVAVLFSWAYAYFTYKRGARLIYRFRQKKENSC